jgi:glycosyltransferase involved in cell wall biosynthesis
MTIRSSTALLSVVVPLYNESAGFEAFHKSVTAVLHDIGMPYELLYVNDGSVDDTLKKLKQAATHNHAVRVLSLTRNFGKEIATTAGINAARGDAVITLDADGQHPVEFIPNLVARWQAGAKIVIGIRTSNQREGFVKRYGSALFYGLFSKLTGIKLRPGLSDFRIIDRTVQQEFVRMTERNRITRGLINWLGYSPEYIPFAAKQRLAGDANYSFRKLVKLAVDSAISLSISPLYIPAYIGAIVLPLASLTALAMLANLIAGDPFGLHVTAGAYVMVLILFLVGILLVSQGIIGLYLSHIHTETQNRPLYVIDSEKSVGIDENNA